jgi:hypothetical protein
MKTTPAFMLFFVLLFFAAFSPAVAGPRETITKEFKLSGFDRLQIGSAFTISVTKGGDFSVKVTGDREKVEDVTAQVRSSELVVAFKENNSRIRLGTNAVRVEIVMPSLRAVNFGGTSASVVNEGFETDNFVAYVTGTAKTEIHMKSREVFVDITGSGSVELIGSSQMLKATVEGASGLNALTFKVEDANLDVNGTSVARVNVSKTIQAKASGASTIRYKGDPQIKSQEITRLSSLKKV